MAINTKGAPPNQGDLILKYVVGTTTAFPGVHSDGQCGGIRAGDRLIIKAITPEDPATFNIVPDANGYLPHLAMYLAGNRFGDPDSPSPEGRPMIFAGRAFGNDTQQDVYRVDLGSVFCRWACSVFVEGGKADPTPGATSTLLISYTWDRAWYADKAGIRALVDQPFEQHHFTVYQVDGPRTAPTRVARPFGAEGVSTPDDQALALDYGPIAAAANTTTTQEFRSQVSSTPYPLGSFFFVYFTAAAAKLRSLIFWIRL